MKVRIGFAGEGRSLFLTHPLPFPENRKSQHLVKTYKELIAPLGIAESDLAPCLFVQEEEIVRAWEFLKRFGVEKGQKLIGVNAGAAYGSAKCWLPERFQSVAKRLAEADPSHVVLFFGDATLKTQMGRLCTAPRMVNLAGQTSLRELMALIKVCSILLTNDSGPMHIADALGTPLLALFGSTDPIATGPYSQREEIIQKEVACAPCFKRTCPIDFPCMKKIGVDEVYERVMQKL